MRKTRRSLISLNLAILMFLSLLATPISSAYKKVILDGNGVKTVRGDYTYDLCVVDLNSVTLPDADMFVSEGLIFIGWLYRGYTVMPGATLSLPENARLYAQWTKYRVAYYGNGGQSRNGDTMIEDYRAQYADALFERDGYLFLGWNTKSDGTGKWCRVNDPIPNGTDCALYAQWVKNRTGNYVRYFGASEKESYQYTFYDSFPAVTVIPSLPDKADQYFCGFSRTSGQSSTLGYKPGTKVTLEENTTFYPIYANSGANNNYDLVYDANGGITKNGENVLCEHVCYATPGSMNIYYATSGSLTVFNQSEPFRRTGYRFTGWNTRANGKGTPVSKDTGTMWDIFRLTSENRIYAQWEYAPNRTCLFYFDPIVKHEDTVLWAAIYSEGGIMLELVKAEISRGYPTAAFNADLFDRALEAKLFQLDRNYCPTDEMQRFKLDSSQRHRINRFLT